MAGPQPVSLLLEQFALSQRRKFTGSMDDHGQQLLRLAAVTQVPGQKEHMGGGC